MAHLGNRGLKEYPLEMGSYRIVLKKSGYHDVTYPVHVGRGEHCDGRDENGFQRPVHVPKQGELRSDECFVPGGWFLCGGDSEAENSYSLRRVWLDDFVMSRFPVTNRAYLMFLNSLLSDGREADALKWVPRETAGASENNGSALYARDDDGQFVLPPGNEIEKWELDWPVCMVSGHCAQAYCNWLSGYAALPYRLPSELEWTKSARGVDGRRYVWGNEIDPSYACLGVSHQGRRLPSVVDSYPVDESVYGIRGLSGNMMDWTSSGFRADWKDLSNDSVRVYLGGAWLNYAKSARVSQRLYGNHAGQSRIIGFRVCRSI
jgi:serine/threonine-protein kinase